MYVCRLRDLPGNPGWVWKPCVTSSRVKLLCLDCSCIVPRSSDNLITDHRVIKTMNSDTDLRHLHTHTDTNANLCDSVSKENIQWQSLTAVASTCRDDSNIAPG